VAKGMVKATTRATAKATMKATAKAPAPSAPRHAVLLLPGDIDTPTGGYRYDRHLVLGLRALGWRLDVLSLAGAYPTPDAEALARAEAAVAALAEGTLVIADGLAFGALPVTTRRHAGRLRWVALVHHPLCMESGDAPAAAMRSPLHPNEQQALRTARHIVVTSDATARLLDELALATAPVTVIEPGCAMQERKRPELPPATEPAPPRLLCVASVTARKGHAVLLEALAGLRDQPWALHCVGSLTLEPAVAAAMRELAQALGLQACVHWHGAVEAEALPGHYAAADVFVLPSLYEGYGMVLAEAMLHGLPVVASDTGAAPRLLAGGAGVLVPPGDALALRHALAPLLAEPARREALGRAAAAAAATRVPTWAQASARWDRLLTALLKAQAPTP